MTAAMTGRRAGEGGFTLIETIVALALMGLVLSALASITAQWLPNWNHGVDRIQRSEEIGIALQRISADLAAAEYVPANRELRRPLFDGSELSVMFVRTALGPNVGPGLDVVRVGETTDRRELRDGAFPDAGSRRCRRVRRCRSNCISAIRWCCCARRTACRLPMPVRTRSGKAHGEKTTSCRPSSG